MVNNKIPIIHAIGAVGATVDKNSAKVKKIIPAVILIFGIVIINLN